MSGEQEHSGGTPIGTAAAAPSAAAASAGVTQPSAAKPGAIAPARQGARRSAGSRTSWLGTAAAKVPTSWLTGAVAALFLVATAGFGGLEPAEAQGPTALGAGETHEGTMVALTIQRAVLIDDFPEAGARAEAGERVLSLVVDAENLSGAPVSTLVPVFGEVLRLEALPELALEGAARLDDATIGPVLQPGVPAELVLSWVVPAEAFADAREVRVALHDHELRVGQSVTYGEYWTAPALAAVATLPVEDVGAGADAGEDDADAEGQP